MELPNRLHEVYKKLSNTLVGWLVGWLLVILHEAHTRISVFCAIKARHQFFKSLKNGLHVCMSHTIHL